MQKLIQKYLVANCVAFFVELILCLVLFFLTDGGWFRTYIVEIIYAFAAIIILVNLIISLITFAKLSKAKNKSDITTLKVLGNDIQVAYDFGMIGLIITDDDNNVIWANDLFKGIERNLIDNNIFNYFEGLSRLQNGNSDETSIDFNASHYVVRYLKEAHLFIFKDVTELKNVYDQVYKHTPAIGVITVDNYQDMANMLDDTQVNASLAIIQKVVLDYGKKHHMLVKKYKNDSYLFICNRENYDDILRDKFSLLNAIKDENQEAGFTLSIGIASGNDNYNRLFEMATKALDVALSRGGDQAVASTYGENLQFFGGLSETKEKRNSVESRVMANSFKALIEEAQSIYIMGHDTADLDAIGSSIGLYYFAKGISPNKNIRIVYDEYKLENKTKKAFKKTFSKEEILEMTIQPTKALDEIKNDDLLIVTDVHSTENTMCPALVKKAEHVAIVDHHRVTSSVIQKPETSYIDSSASSASELIAEMIYHAPQSIEMPKKAATFMLAGIILDTNNFRIHTGARTFDASYVLKTYGADSAEADAFLKVELEEYILKNSIMNRATYPEAGILLTYADSNEIVEQAMLARVATEALQISGIQASFVIGRVSEKDIGLSSRSDGSISCQLICESLKGGGSFTSAAARFRDTTNVHQVKELVEDALKNYVNGQGKKKILGGD